MSFSPFQQLGIDLFATRGVPAMPYVLLPAIGECRGVTSYTEGRRR